jgi:CRP/FNR family cyclic AMP-dependent transcriptional regulator
VDEVSFRAGDILFHEGDPSDCVFRITAGQFEIWRELEGGAVLLGHVDAGEFLGEMGVLEHRPRSAEARATALGTAEVMTPHEFFDRVSADPGLARELILRLSVRLRAIEDKMVGLAPHAKDALRVSGLPAPPDPGAAEVDLLLSAETEELRTQLGATPIRVTNLPFIVGRVPVANEAKPGRHPDLLIEDKKPFRMSRAHFMIARESARLVVRDLDSTLGTIVNGQAIGHHFRTDTAELHAGANHVTAGGVESPFRFALAAG